MTLLILFFTAIGEHVLKAPGRSRAILAGARVLRDVFQLQQRSDRPMANGRPRVSH